MGTTPEQRRRGLAALRAANVLRARDRAEALRRRVLDALAASAIPLAQVEVAWAIGYTSLESILRARLDELESAGLIVKGRDRREWSSGRARYRRSCEVDVWSITGRGPGNASASTPR